MVDKPAPIWTRGAAGQYFGYRCCLNMNEQLLSDYKDEQQATLQQAEQLFSPVLAAHDGVKQPPMQVILGKFYMLLSFIVKLAH